MFNFTEKQIRLLDEAHKLKAKSIPDPIGLDLLNFAQLLALSDLVSERERKMAVIREEIIAEGLTDPTNGKMMRMEGSVMGEAIRRAVMCLTQYDFETERFQIKSAISRLVGCGYETYAHQKYKQTVISGGRLVTKYTANNEPPYYNSVAEAVAAVGIKMPQIV